MSTARISDFLTRLRQAGPYLAIELLLPGGTMIALLLWLSQRLVSARLSSMHSLLASRLTGRPAITAPPFSHGEGACESWEEPARLCLGCR